MNKALDSFDMCYHITFLFPKDVQEDTIKRIEVSSSLRFSEEYSSKKLTNAFLETQIQTDEVYAWKKGKYCDCGTTLGEVKRINRSTDKSISLESQIKKLKQRGWTTAKTNKWLSNKKISKGNSLRRSEQLIEQTENDNSETNQYINLIKVALEEVKYICILLHWYDKDFESERFEIQKRVSIPLCQLKRNLLLNIDEDVIYQFEN